MEASSILLRGGLTQACRKRAAEALWFHHKMSRLQSIFKNTIKIFGENVYTQGLWAILSVNISEAQLLLGLATEDTQLWRLSRNPNLCDTMGRCWLEVFEEDAFLGSSFLDNRWENRRPPPPSRTMFVRTSTCSPTCETLSAWRYFEVFFFSSRIFKISVILQTKEVSEVWFTSVFGGVKLRHRNMNFWLLSEYIRGWLGWG